MDTAEILKKVRQIEIQTNKLVSETFAGEYLSTFKGQGIEFAEVREYIPGDDIRSIDWNVTARTGTPYIKKYNEESRPKVIELLEKYKEKNIIIFKSRSEADDFLRRLL